MTIADEPADVLLTTEEDLDEAFGSPDGERLNGHRPAKRPTARVNRITLSKVKPQRVRWLWSGYLPLGKVTILEGDPGLGKSTLTIALAASVSAGVPFPDGTSVEPADVLLVTYEDGVADTIVPRLLAAGGDSEHVHVLDGVSYDNGEDRLLSFPEDVAALAEEIRATGARLVVLDPLGAALSARTDSYKDADVRRALAPLKLLAEAEDVAIVVVRHLAKGARRHAISAGAGSIGIGAAARLVLVVHQDPEDKERRVLAVVKNNLAKEGASQLFHLADAGNGAARVVWDGRSSLSADDLTAARSDDPGDRSAIEEARDWLLQALAGGPKPKRNLLDAAKRDNITQRTLERAKGLAGVKHQRDGFGAPVMWSLPAVSPIAPNLANLATVGGTGENGETGEIEHRPNEEVA